MERNKTGIGGVVKRMRGGAGISKELVASIQDSKAEFVKSHNELRDRYMIDGKTIANWDKRFKLNIPKDATPTQCKELVRDLAELHHEATFYYSQASMAEKAILGRREAEHRAAYADALAESGRGTKPVPATTLKTMSDKAVQEIDDILVNASITREFWKEKIEHLKYLYKLINDITINIGYEIKLQPGAS